jgi:hypothetical protein
LEPWLDVERIRSGAQFVDDTTAQCGGKPVRQGHNGIRDEQAGDREQECDG